MFRRISSIALFLMLLSSISFAENKEEPLSIEILQTKFKGSWTEVIFAIKNNGAKDSDISCCNAYIENEDGYAIASLNRDELQAIIHNKAKTAALIGTIAGAGMGIGGLAGNVDELAYAGLATAGASAIAGVAGEAAADSQRRGVIVDNIMRNRVFPAGLKIAGAVYFPPRKKWPSSDVPKALHITYDFKGEGHRISSLIPEDSLPKKGTKRRK